MGMKAYIYGLVHLDTTNKVGTYTITFSHDKFSTKTIKTNVGMNLGDDCNCDFKIKLNMTDPVNPCVEEEDSKIVPIGH